MLPAQNAFATPGSDRISSCLLPALSEQDLFGALSCGRSWLRSSFGRLRASEGISEPHPGCNQKRDRPGFLLVLRMPIPSLGGWKRVAQRKRTACDAACRRPWPTGCQTGRKVSPCPPSSAPGAAAFRAGLVPRDRVLVILFFKMQPVSLLNPVLLSQAALIYGISSENNVQKGVCRAGCAKPINPGSSLVPLKGFWESNIRQPGENTHGFSFRVCVCSLPLFIFVLTIKVTRRKSPIDTPTAALRPVVEWSVKTQPAV